MQLPQISILIASLYFIFVSCGSDTGMTSQLPGELREDSIRSYVKTLSSDAFLGRMPFTEGETLTINYLTERMKAYGLEPGNGDSYVQEVPLVDIHSEPDRSVSVQTPSGKSEWTLGDDFVAFSEHEQDEISINDSEFIFCGYGVVAPEYDWNDFEGIDVEGKTIVVLVNDPGLYSGDTTFFKGAAMTYYGRWTYKYEEAARQGAAGVMIVHETDMAGYPWTVVRNSWVGSQQRLQSDDRGASKSKVQGWMTTETAQKLFEQSGLDFDQLKKDAARPGFKPIKLNSTWSISIQNQMTYNKSNNVIAKISGHGAADENLIFTAHWDHFGIATPVNGDSIYNGAIDNGTGIAALMEIGRVYKEAGFEPERSIIFLFVTAEEQGLLGSEYYTTHPIYPVTSTVANLNIDQIEDLGPMKDVTMIGYGHSTFDEIVAEVAQKQNRYVLPDQEPEKGFYFRSDHFNFAKVGIPALFAGGAYEHRDKGVEYARQKLNEFNMNRYHQPADEYSPDMDFEGIMMDIQLYYDIGWKIASGEVTPEWKEGSEFKR